MLLYIKFFIIQVMFPTIAILFLLASLSSCNPVSIYLENSLDIRRPINSVMVERDLPVRMSDGAILRADLFHPRDGELKSPTILVRIPLPDTIKYRAFSSAVGNLFAKRGYTVVVQGVRGRYRSGGQYYPLIHERQDGLDTLAWIEQQPFFDGRLATWGGSYFGYTQWAIAPELSRVGNVFALQISSSSFYNMFYPGGAVSFADAVYWSMRDRGEVPTATELLKECNRRFFSRTLPEDPPYLSDWLNRQSDKKYWHAIDGADRPELIKSPALFLAGWFDPFLPEQIRDFQRTASSSKRIVIGPWAHAETVTLADGTRERNYRIDSLESAMRWFDGHFFASGEESSRTAKVLIYVQGSNKWREEDEWPLKRGELRELFLSGSSASGDRGALSIAGVDVEPSSRFVFDPLNPVPTLGGSSLGPLAGVVEQSELDRRADILRFLSEQLAEDLEVTGEVSVKLYVRSTARTTDFTAKLIEQREDGTAFNVTDGIVRLPPDEPNKVREISIELWPTSIVFKKGHTIRLDISSSNFPRYDVNPNSIPNAITRRWQKAQQEVFHSNLYPSRVILPVIPSTER